jgi:hypothetical protein
MVFYSTITVTYYSYLWGNGWGVLGEMLVGVIGFKEWMLVEVMGFEK